MRIIAGERRGQKLLSPRDKNTRPTSDLVREAIFNILGADVEGARVIDLFAGSGALGLEALSRGAESALFVERNRSNVEVITQNIGALRYEHKATLLAADAFRWATRDRVIAPGRDREPAVVFLDPPYAEYENHPGRVTRLVESLARKLPSQSAIVLEAGSHQVEHVLTNQIPWDVRRYGGVAVAIHRACGDGVEVEEGGEGAASDDVSAGSQAARSHG